MINKKAILGMLIIVLPGVIFALMRFVGKNHYMLPPVETPKIAGCESYIENGTHKVPSFSMLNQDSTVYTEQKLQDKIYVAEFFFSTCPTTCVQMTSELLRVQEYFQDNESIKIVSYSVNPEYDSPEVLKTYASTYGINPDFWTLLTGSKEEIYDIARWGYFVVAKPDEADAANFIHTDKVVLVDKDKQIRGYYNATDREDVDRLITEIQVLMQEYRLKS